MKTTRRNFYKKLAGSLALGTGLSLGTVALPSLGQAQDYYRYNPEHRRPVETTIEDLKDIATRLVPRGDNRRRFDDAIIHLTQFADKLHEGGRFDKGLLDDCIGNVQNILDHGHLPPEPEQILSRDVTDLRQLRQHYDDRRYRYR